MDKKKYKKSTDPIDKEEEVPRSNDERIDQDVPGFPHHPSQPEEDIKKKKKAKDESDNVG